MKTKNFSLLLLTGLLMISCGKDLPKKYQALNGIWTNEEVYMKIDSDGSFKYKRQSKGESVSIDTWITEYSDKGFTVSVVFGSTDFVLNRAPFYDSESKTTKMIVDGRTLTKQDSW